MNRLENLKQKVADLYGAKEPDRDGWTDWLYENHVLVVAKGARTLAEKYGANVELAEVAALLHDVADYKMPRRNHDHEAESLRVARAVMAECGYTPDEIVLVVDDAIRFHSCHDDERPNSTEGLILATADSLAHLKTDFYIFAAWSFGKDRGLEELKAWVLKKIERDLYSKISFEDERRDAKPDYELVKNLFSR